MEERPDEGAGNCWESLVYERYEKDNLQIYWNFRLLVWISHRDKITHCLLKMTYFMIGIYLDII